MRSTRLAVLAALLVGVAACSAPRADLAPHDPPPVGGPVAATAEGQRLAFAAERYRSQVFAATTKTADITYGTGPDLITGATVTLRLDVYRPVGDAAISRPLIVWIHGGAFAYGDKGWMQSIAEYWTRLGYVTASIDYRLDIGNHCQQVQDGVYDGDPTRLAAEQARCLRAIIAARDDAAAAIAWLRAHAATYGVDPTRIAVGGASAGAITAVHVGQAMNTAGSPPPAASRVSAVLAMSGCNYLAGTIDALDAPVAMSASGGDPLVPFACSAATVDAAAAFGTPVWRNLYPLESAHAEVLYYAHQSEIDRGWRLFLIDQLELA